MKYAFKHRRNYLLSINRILTQNFGDIWRKSGEILGKYRALGVGEGGGGAESVGSKGLKAETPFQR